MSRGQISVAPAPALSLSLSLSVHRVVDTVLGPLTLVGVGEVLTGVYYPDHSTRPDRTAFGPSDPGALREAERQIRDYLAGRRTTFELKTALPAGPPRHRAVWDLITAIPRGETRSYGGLAAALAPPGHPRAVGSAVARNPLSIVVPCHRVIGGDGSLTGYAGGVERKRALLELDGVP